MLISFPVSFTAHVRLLAATIHPLKARDRRRQIAIEAGRYSEALLQAGQKRWQATKAEDELIEALYQRLDQLDQISCEAAVGADAAVAGGAA